MRPVPGRVGRHRAGAAGTAPAVRGLRGPAADEAGRRQKAQLAEYWRESLRDLPVLGLPTDRPRRRTQTFRGDVLGFALDDGAVGRLLALAAERSTTPFTCFLAVFAVLLAEWSGQSDVPVGTITSGREDPEVRDVVGYFVNTLALRADLSGAPSFRQLIDRTRRMVLGTFAHQALPFAEVVEAVRLARRDGRSPLFQVLFTIAEDAGTPIAELPGVTATVEDVRHVGVPIDLVLNVDRTPTGFAAAFEYNTDLFDRSTIEASAARFRALLRQLVTGPDRPVVLPPGSHVSSGENIG